MDEMRAITELMQAAGGWGVASLMIWALFKYHKATTDLLEARHRWVL